MNVSPISSRILMYYVWQLKPEQFSIPSFWNMIPTYGIYPLAGWHVLGFPCGAELRGSQRESCEGRRMKREKVGQVLVETGLNLLTFMISVTGLEFVLAVPLCSPANYRNSLFCKGAIYCRSLPPTLTHWFLYRVSQWNVKMYIFLNCICHTLQP